MGRGSQNQSAASILDIRRTHVSASDVPEAQRTFVGPNPKSRIHQTGHVSEYGFVLDSVEGNPAQIYEVPGEQELCHLWCKDGRVHRPVAEGPAFYSRSAAFSEVEIFAEDLLPSPIDVDRVLEQNRLEIEGFKIDELKDCMPLQKWHLAN